MTCFFCKGTVENAFSSYTTDFNGCIIAVKNVPSQMCKQCGDVSYNSDVARQLEKIIRQITSSVKTEVAIVNYSDKAA